MTTHTPTHSEQHAAEVNPSTTDYTAIAGKHTVVYGHPTVDLISVYLNPLTTAEDTPQEVEVAFFQTRNGRTEWVLDTVEEFAAYADPIAVDTRVYPGVPLIDVLTWIDRYQEAPGMTPTVVSEAASDAS